MDWISSLLLATVRLAIPVLLISLAELYGQRAGMVNIGLEGLASIGALVGFLVCYITGSNWLGLLCGALAGIAVNMIYAFSTITLCANHTVYGMAINILPRRSRPLSTACTSAPARTPSRSSPCPRLPFRVSRTFL